MHPPSGLSNIKDTGCSCQFDCSKTLTTLLANAFRFLLLLFISLCMCIFYVNFYGLFLFARHFSHFPKTRHIHSLLGLSFKLSLLFDDNVFNYMVMYCCMPVCTQYFPENWREPSLLLVHVKVFTATFLKSLVDSMPKNWNFPHFFNGWRSHEVVIKIENDISY